MIELKNIEKNYGERSALHGLTVAVPDGSVFGAVGVNGAGKSTLLRLMAGVLRADGGEILYDGEPVYENIAVKKNIFFLPDEPFYSSGTTGKQLADLYKAFYADFDENTFESRCTLFNLDRNAPVRNFSKGMRRQIFLSLALACRPKYLLLDEAFDGLDPQARLEFKRALIDLTENGSTAVIASHSLRELTDICTDFALLGDGKAELCGNLQDSLASIHKFQAAFDREIGKSDLPFECVAFERQGRIVQVIARGDAETIRGQIEALSPLFAEEIPIDFEEFFLAETDRRQI